MCVKNVNLLFVSEISSGVSAIADSISDGALFPWKIETATSFGAALRKVAREQFDICLVDNSFREADSHQFLTKIAAEHPGLALVILDSSENGLSGPEVKDLIDARLSLPPPPSALGPSHTQKSGKLASCGAARPQRQGNQKQGGPDRGTKQRIERRHTQSGQGCVRNRGTNPGKSEIADISLYRTTQKLQAPEPTTVVPRHYREQHQEDIFPFFEKPDHQNAPTEFRGNQGGGPDKGRQKQQGDCKYTRRLGKDRPDAQVPHQDKTGHKEQRSWSGVLSGVFPAVLIFHQHLLRYISVSSREPICRHFTQGVQSFSS